MKRGRKSKIAGLQARIDAAMRFMQLELIRIKKAHRFYLNEFKPRSPRDRSYAKTMLVELPAQGHLTATMVDVLHEMLLNGNIPNKREAAVEKAELEAS